MQAISSSRRAKWPFDRQKGELTARFAALLFTGRRALTRRNAIYPGKLGITPESFSPLLPFWPPPHPPRCGSGRTAAQSPEYRPAAWPVRSPHLPPRRRRSAAPFCRRRQKSCESRDPSQTPLRTAYLPREYRQHAGDRPARPPSRRSDRRPPRWHWQSGSDHPAVSGSPRPPLPRWDAPNMSSHGRSVRSRPCPVPEPPTFFR